ncbi:MAG: hypothetical protein VB031_03525 [Eubacteriaceae bacterium]|nr:hypothetical protein [Eubacteriaceae bacterium]
MKDFKDMSKLERQIEMLKYCHKPRTFTEIADHFGIEDRTRQRYTNDYLEEMDFPGMDINVHLENSAKGVRMDGDEERYFASVHPVCLALNMSQIFLLTVGLLDRIPEDDVMYEAYQVIVNNIYSQLSGYAKEIVDNNNHGHDFEEIWSSAFTSETELFKEDTNSHKLLYLLKSQKAAEITFEDSDGKAVTVERKLSYKNGVLFFLYKGKKREVNCKMKLNN